MNITLRAELNVTGLYSTGGAGLTPCGRVKGPQFQLDFTPSFALKNRHFWRVAGEKRVVSHFFFEKASPFWARALLRK